MFILFACSILFKFFFQLRPQMDLHRFCFTYPHHRCFHRRTNCRRPEKYRQLLSAFLCLLSGTKRHFNFWNLKKSLKSIQDWTARFRFSQAIWERYSRHCCKSTVVWDLWCLACLKICLMLWNKTFFCVSKRV